MSKFFRKHWKPFIFSISLLIFASIVTLLLKEQVHIIDNFIFSIVEKIRCKPLTSFFKFITFFCDTEFLLIVTISIMVFSKRKKDSFYIALNVLLCFLLNQTLKHIFLRTRPEDINLIVQGGYSFPSGHSMLSLAFYGFFIYLIYHMRMKKNKKLLYCFLLTLLVLLIGFSRIYLGVHYASDVIAGFAISMAYLIIFILIFYKKMKDS